MKYPITERMIKMYIFKKELEKAIEENKEYRCGSIIFTNPKKLYDFLHENMREDILNRIIKFEDILDEAIDLAFQQHDYRIESWESKRGHAILLGIDHEYDEATDEDTITFTIISNG